MVNYSAVWSIIRRFGFVFIQPSGFGPVIWPSGQVPAHMLLFCYTRKVYYCLLKFYAYLVFTSALSIFNNKYPGDLSRNVFAITPELVFIFEILKYF